MKSPRIRPSGSIIRPPACASRIARTTRWRLERVLQRIRTTPLPAVYWAQQGRVAEARREWREVERPGRLWLGYAAEALILQATDPARVCGQGAKELLEDRGHGGDALFFAVDAVASEHPELVFGYSRGRIRRQRHGVEFEFFGCEVLGANGIAAN